MDLIKTVLLYMMMLVGTATGVSPEVTPIPANALPTPTPYVTQAPTAVPTAQPVTPRPTTYNTLYVGDKGSAVRVLQNRLKELGYLTGNVDGSYGAQTKTAVETFQRANGLKVDGIAGRNTQQIMFESPNVVPARSATLIPTAVPVTPTPVAPAPVVVRYVDASTNQLLRQTTVQCYGDTYVYADATNVPSTYRLISNSYVAIRVANGQASPATVTFYYQRGTTAAPSTGVSVPVYYLDSTNLIIARETRTLYQSGTVAADASLIPAGYTLTGSTVVYVTVSGTIASPNPVLFRLNRNSTTPTPAPVSGVVVPVNYVDATTGRTFASQNVTLYSSGTVYPQNSLVPAGYTLISASSVTVSIANGRAYPTSVTFTYRPYQPTATPVVGVTVPIYYVDSTTNRTVFTTSASLTTSQLLFANMSQVPGYSLASASSVYVTVSNGRANPSSVTFRVTPNATPTPAQRQIAVAVRYIYNSQLIAGQTVYLLSGTTSTVYADASVYGSNYVISGSSSTRVTVSASGVATPSVVTFYVVPRATATPTAVPYIQVSVPVRYLYGTRLIASQTVTLTSGTTSTVYADASVYSRQYDLASASSVRVTVSRNGVASPALVTFYLTPKATPTPVPVTEVPVTVRYMYGSRLIASYQEMCRTNQTTTIYADSSVYASQYELQGSDRVNVTVDARGTANPSVVTFYLVEKATPTPVPAQYVNVNVEYRTETQLVSSYLEPCKIGENTTIYVKPYIYEGRYMLYSDTQVDVYVDRNGNPNPAVAVFYLRPLETEPPVTPAPAYEVPVTVEYRYNNQPVYSAVVMVTSGRSTEVRADISVLGGQYVMDGTDRMNVNVTADGIASPNPVVFQVKPNVEPITPAPPTAAPITPEPITPAPITPEPITPAPVTPVPPAPGPSGNINQEVPTYQTGIIKSRNDVYQGPGFNYWRNGKALYAGGVARIYGYDGDWLLMGYELKNGDYRVGYIHNFTLPDPTSRFNPDKVPQLTYAWIPTTVVEDTSVTDDPVINMKQIDKLAAGTPVTFLAWMSSKHNYALIEYQSEKLGTTVRAFIKGYNLQCMK